MANDRSGSATTSSAPLALANVNRAGLDIQNVGTVDVGVNEFGGPAVIGQSGTWTLPPKGVMKVRTSLQVNIISASGTVPVTATEH